MAQETQNEMINASVVLRTIWQRPDGVTGEGWRLLTRTVRDVTDYPDVGDPVTGMTMQTGRVRIAHASATVSRWVGGVDENGQAYTTPWTTEGVLVGGVYREAVGNEATVRWNDEGA